MRGDTRRERVKSQSEFCHRIGCKGERAVDPQFAVAYSL